MAKQEHGLAQRLNHVGDILRFVLDAVSDSRVRLTPAAAGNRVDIKELAEHRLHERPVRFVIAESAVHEHERMPGAGPVVRHSHATSGRDAFHRSRIAPFNS